MARGKRPKPARGASPAMDLKLDGEFWAALHEAARLDTAGDPAAAAQHMRAWRAERAAKEQTRQDALGADSDAAAGEDVEDLLGI